jgi:hypothetical protein
MELPLNDIANLKYPIGKFDYSGKFDWTVVDGWIREIEELPSLLREVVTELTEDQLNTPYRSGGWMLRQVIHHIGDSHINCYIRFKWALTENNPIIKPYDEKAWAELADYSDLRIEDSLRFIEALHKKWVILLRSLSEEDLNRKFIHPETKQVNTLWKNIGAYAWHGRHHLGHIMSLKRRKQR